MNNIKKYRSEKGLSQAELGSYLNVSRAGMCYIEKKDGVVAKKTAKILCDVFGCTEVELNGMSCLSIIPETESDKKYLIKTLCKTLEDAELSKKITNLLSE